jgi:uncharacterized protein
MSDIALVIMARYPLPGTTKTRLARKLGDTATLQLYQAFLSDLAYHFAGSDYDLHWAYAPAEADFAGYIALLVPDVASQTHCFPQTEADFGTRLFHAFQQTHQQGYAATILIGSDSPHVTLALLEQAQKGLQEADVVLGPADDGGYYLIAMREPYDLFSDIPMSTSRVTEMTLARASSLGLTTRLIEPLFDIDEYDDLLRLTALLQTNSELAPVTAALIAHLDRRSMYDHDSTHNLELSSNHPATLDLH